MILYGAAHTCALGAGRQLSRVENLPPHPEPRGWVANLRFFGWPAMGRFCSTMQAYRAPSAIDASLSRGARTQSIISFSQWSVLFLFFLWLLHNSQLLQRFREFPETKQVSGGRNGAGLMMSKFGKRASNWVECAQCNVAINVGRWNYCN